MKNPIFDIENWREIGATLARNKTRTFLTAFGIFWGTAMLAMLWGGAKGLEGMLMRNFSGFATNLGAVFPSRTTMPYKGYNKGMEWNLTINDIANIRRMTPGIDCSTTISGIWGKVNYATKSKNATAIGIESDYTRILVPVIYSGRLINQSDVASTRKVAVIGKNLADELFGDEPSVGKYISINGIYLLVIGVAGQTSEVQLYGRIDDSVLIPSSTMFRAFRHTNDVEGFLYTAVKGKTPSDLQPYIRRAVFASHPIDPDDDGALWFMDISERFKMVDTLFLGISLLALFVGAGSLMAGIIGVGNIMWIIVKERTQEIGIRRAIGAKPRDIIMQILSESVVLTTVAGIAGVCFATIVLGIADKITYDPVLGSAHFELHFRHAVFIVLTFMTLGTAAGTMPAIKAMRIKPVEAMRDR